MKSICFVLTTDIAVKAFLINHLRALSKSHQITLVVNTTTKHLLSQYETQGELVPIAISRNINLFGDFLSLVRIVRLIRHHKFDAIHSVTPKAGLLAMLAGFICRTPLRVHTFTGQVWATKSGIKRLILKFIDRFFAALATHLIVDSPSQRDFLLREKVISSSKCYVFGEGSIAGVDLQRFKPDGTARSEIRHILNINDSDLVFLFLGRLNPDKGVLDLASAFIAANIKNAHLIYVGPDEQGMQNKISGILNFGTANIQFVSYTDTPERYMAASDVLCLPSYREGFGSVIIEAAACGIPSIASRIYGISDAVIDKKTGLLHEPKNILELTSLLQKITSDKTLYTDLAKNAHLRAISKFDSKIITKAWCDFYSDLFNHAR